MSRYINHIITIVTILAVCMSVGMTAYRYIVLRDYLVQVETSCDPAEEACFVYECESEDEEGCIALGESYYSPYAIVVRDARHVPLCASDSEADCDVRDCGSDASCHITYCDPETRMNEQICLSEVAYE